MPESDRMRIAFVYDVIYPFVRGGVEKRVWELSVRLAARGHDVHIFGMKGWEGNDTITREGVTLHGVCPSQNLYISGRRKVGEPVFFSIRLFFSFLKEERFDLIDCQQFPFFPCLSARLVSLIRKTRLTITWHEVWGEYWYGYLGWAGGGGKLIERMVATIRCPVIAVSDLTVTRFRSHFRKNVDAVIPNGIDLSRIAAVTAKGGKSDIVFAGRLIKEKHVDTLVMAFHLLMTDLPELRLIIIGDGPERASIESLAEKYAPGKIVFQGFVEDHGEVIATMKSSKIFVIPSTREGFGIAALEALACGLPVVTIDNPANAIRDLITEETGFLCSLSPEDLAAAIRLALARCDTMRRACRESAARYDWDRITDQAEQFYHSLIDEKS